MRIHPFQAIVRVVERKLALTLASLVLRYGGDMPRRQKTAIPSSQHADELDCYLSLAVAGVGLAAVAVGTIYYFYGCAHSSEHRRKMQILLRRMQSSLGEQASWLSSMNPASVRQVVEKALTFYEDVNGAAQSGRRSRKRA